MRLRKKRFYAVSFLFALAGALMVWQLCLIGRQPGPFGYGEAAIQTMHGKLVYAIMPGTRQIQVDQYLFEETETGSSRNFMIRSPTIQSGSIGTKEKFLSYLS